MNKTISDDEIKILENHLSFSNMKGNPAVNYEDAVVWNKKLNLTNTNGDFMRNGCLNQWKNNMSEDTIELFNKWIAENCQGSDLY